MARITQRSCDTKNSKLKFDKKSRQYVDNCNNNCHFIDNKDKK